MATDARTETAFAELEELVEPIITLEGATHVLGWDQQVMMPEGGTPARSKQMATMSRLHHDLLTDDRIGDLLDELEEVSLDTEESAVVREVRRQYDRAVSVPRDLIEEIAETSAKAHPVWREARESDDFDAFAPLLERIVELRREYAKAIDAFADPYAVLFAEYEPYLPLETADRVLTTLRDDLVPLIDAIHESDTDVPTDAFDGTFAPSTQESLARDALDTLGYDWDHGRLDTAPHPFSTGTQFDARVTTRFEESDLLSAISSTIHEFGHAHYTLGLPRDAYGSHLGQPRDLSVHESQSRLWENHIGRSRPFWSNFLPTVSEHFPKLSAVTVDEAYAAANQVYTDNLIRVDADELTYHLHIIIRYEIERGLIDGTIDVEEVPTVWNDKYEEYLGIRPETDANGCLQDIHWSNGSIGYFPTYSLGSVMAAQLYAAMERDLGTLDSRIEAGEFDAITNWLREHVHELGRTYTTPDLVERATGEAYTASYFTDYVSAKYGDLYGL